MLKKVVMSVMLTFSLQACTTLEIVHADLELPCVPNHGVYFSIGETKHVKDETYDKFEKIILTYKQRIITQCELVNNHNLEHSK